MQQLIGEPPGRITPVDETVNIFEVEAMAQRRLDALTYAEIAGSDRRAFDRMTFRPRMMVDTTKLDLTLQLFGSPMFSQIAPEAKAGFWYQVYPDTDKQRLGAAVAAGCKAVCLTLSDSGDDWKSIDAMRQGLKVPFLLKGVMNAGDAGDAVKKGVQGVVVSSYVAGPVAANAMASPMEVLPGIVDAGGKIPILIDGSFRRGSDILMALALGATGVIIGRPVAWGLAAFGAPGVQHVMELLQSELARDMAMCGKVDLKAIDKSMVKVHKW